MAHSDQAEGHHFPYPDVYGSVRFIMDHTDVLPHGHEYFQLRDGLANSKAKFENDKTGRVVLLGGSITFNPGWRDELMHYLQQRAFPANQEFDFIAANAYLQLEFGATCVSTGSRCAGAWAGRSVICRGCREGWQQHSRPSGIYVAGDGRHRAQHNVHGKPQNGRGLCR